MLRNGMMVEVIGGRYDGKRGYIFDNDGDEYTVELNDGDIEKFDEFELEIIK